MTNRSRTKTQHYWTKKKKTIFWKFSRTRITTRKQYGKNRRKFHTKFFAKPPHETFTIESVHCKSLWEIRHNWPMGNVHSAFEIYNIKIYTYICTRIRRQRVSKCSKTILTVPGNWSGSSRTFWHDVDVDNFPIGGNSEKLISCGNVRACAHVRAQIATNLRARAAHTHINDSSLTYAF